MPARFPPRRAFALGKRLPEPLAVVRFNHAVLELWPSHCRTVFSDCKEVTAAPNGNETLADTVIHEALHSAIQEALTNSPSLCLRAVADGDGNRWTPERKHEEGLALSVGFKMADLFRQMRKAYG